MSEFCTWRLEGPCPGHAWERIVQRVHALAHQGLPRVNDALATAPVPAGWRGWPHRIHRHAVHRLNRPAPHLELGSPGHPRIWLAPSAATLPSGAGSAPLAVEVLPHPHEGQAQWGDRLHALAWVGTLAHLVDEPAMGTWVVLDSSLPPTGWADLRAWAAGVWAQVPALGQPQSQ